MTTPVTGHSDVLVDMDVVGKMLQSEFELTEELCYLLIQQQEKQQCNEVRSARLGSHQAIFN